MHRTALGVLVLACTWTHSFAADCEQARVDTRGLRTAVVASAAPRTYFIEGSWRAPECPNQAQTCRSKAYVVPGDIVLLTAVSGEFVCATFAVYKGLSTTGWLPADALLARPQAAPGFPDWIGDWATEDQHIKLAELPSGKLAITGDATWGGHDPERVRRGGVNTGELDATAAPAGHTLAFTEDGNDTLAYDKGGEADCRVQMRLLGPYLVVADNMNCGGMNVTFSGAYRRKR